jgi:hypothetical protein
VNECGEELSLCVCGLATGPEKSVRQKERDSSDMGLEGNPSTEA